MQTNDNRQSLDTQSISKIHHNLQNTLNTSFWLLIDFDSPTQSSEGRQPHFTKKQPRPRDGTREAPLTGRKGPEQYLGCGSRPGALSLCHPLPDRGWEGNGLLLLGLEDPLSEAVGDIFEDSAPSGHPRVSGRHHRWLREKTSIRWGGARPCRDSCRAPYHSHRTVTAPRLAA